jgi:hypothetical protein
MLEKPATRSPTPGSPPGRTAHEPPSTYFGEEFTYAEEFPAFEYAEFQEALADDEEANNGRATGVALRLAVACVAEKDRGRFRKVSRENRAKVEDWLTGLPRLDGGGAEPTALLGSPPTPRMGLTAAAINGAQDYTPIDVGERVEAWRVWLASDPAEQPVGESFADRVARFQEQVEAQYEGVA